MNRRTFFSQSMTRLIGLFLAIMLAVVLTLETGDTATSAYTGSQAPPIDVAPMLQSCSPTNVTGIIDIDTTWNQACSPYILNGNVSIQSGVVLTIEPGVVIQYAGAYELLVKGAIVANGTVGAPITFTTGGAPSGATLLRFADTSVTASQLSYLKLEYATQGIVLGGSTTGTLTVSNVEVNNTGLRTDGSGSTLLLSQATITGSTVKGSYAYGGPIVIQASTISNTQLTSDNYAQGITIQNSTVTNSPFTLGCCGAKIRIENSTVSASSVQGCCGSPVNGPLEIIGSQIINTPIDVPAASLTMLSSTLQCNGGTGLKFGNGTIGGSSVIGNESGVGVEITGLVGYNIGGSVTITTTTIMRHGVGLKVSGANVVTAQNNNLTQNTSYHIENRTAQNIAASNNYWGTTDAAQIAASIFDYYDDINYGKVEYSNSLTSPNTAAQISPPKNVTKSSAGSGVQLRWSANPEPDVAGYKVYYGALTGYSFANVADVGNVTS